MRMRLIILISVFMFFTSQAKAASFFTFSDEYEYYRPTDVSADGSVVVGDTTYGSAGPAFYFVFQNGSMELVARYYPEDYYGESTFAGGVSADGIVVVGANHDNYFFDPFYWTRKDGMVFLYKFGGEVSSATAASSDGTVIVGYSRDYHNEIVYALCWTQNGDTISLDNIAGYSSSGAYDVSNDGSVIVGESWIYYPTKDHQAFRWTQNDGTVGLGFLPEDNASTARSISADGSVIVGWSGYTVEGEESNLDSYGEAFRWTQDGGMIGLGVLPGAPNSYAADVNYNGAIIVGNSGEYPFIWDNENGMRRLDDVLTSVYGIDLTEWEDWSVAMDAKSTVTAISADGNTIVGFSESKFPNRKGWIADINISKGSLEVTIDPLEAVSAGARWQVDGGDWNNSGDLLVEIDPGDYTINFNEIPGWKPPDIQTETVIALTKNSISATYTKVENGSLQVTIQPSAVISIGAQWRVDMGEWQSSGYTKTDLEPGGHIVEFKNIGVWTAPDNQSVEISSGETTSISGTYIQYTGSLTITIEPATAISAGAKWRVDGGEWKDSGTTQDGLAIGDHIVEFNTVPNFNTPGAQSVNIKTNETATISQTYSTQSGSLTVTISPIEAVSAGAKWRLYGDNWHNSGETISNLGIGNHWVEFNEVPGWQEPDFSNATITHGQTTTITGVYVNQEGSLTVTIEPAAVVAAGSKWRVDGGPWQNSGDIVTGLDNATYSVEFKAVTGWTTPDIQTITIADGEDVTISGTYTQSGNEGDDSYGCFINAINQGSIW